VYEIFGHAPVVKENRHEMYIYIYIYIHIYIIIYEIKYKTNVVTQSFMPEFTDNLRTTKVDRLVLFAFACMLARSSVVYHGARCSIARECIFPPEIVFYGRNSRIFHFFCLAASSF
jgi:hypothetical protein